ncbi:MAG: hypothetical protein LUC17_04085 [Oscillospiraceae bacterium]|nr:hypothetical protein [Oscillospiraceae bacterium]
MYVDGAWSPYDESSMGHRNEKYVDYTRNVKKCGDEYEERRKKGMCPYCHGMGGKHDPRCPYFEPPKAKYRCALCGEGIYPHEEYIENESGKHAHLKCVCETLTSSELLDWLDVDVEQYWDWED